MKRLHRISLTVGLLALLAIGVLAAATHFGSNLIVRKGNSWLVDRGIPIRIGDVRFRNEWEMVQLRLTDACAYDGLDPDAVTIGCVDKVDLYISVRPSLQRPFGVSKVRVHDVDVDLSNPEAIGRLLAQIQERPESAESEPGPRQRTRTRKPTLPDDFPIVTVDRVRISAPEGSPITSLELREFATERAENDSALPPGTFRWRFEGAAEVSPDNAPSALVSLLADGIMLSGTLETDLDWTAAIQRSDGDPLGLALPALGEDANLLIAELRLDSARTVSLLAPSLHAPAANGLAVRSALVQVELREWTTNVEDIYFSRLYLTDFDAKLDVGDGTLSDALGQLLAGAPEAAAAEVDSDAADAVDEAGDPATREDDLWSGRKWYEKVPQRIQFSSGRFELGFNFDDEEGSRGILLIEGASLDYALRAIRTQADLTAKAEVSLSGAIAGTVEADLTWNWALETLALEASIENLEIGAFTAITPKLREIAPIGSMLLDVTYRDRPNGDVEKFEGSFVLGGFIARLSPFPDGIALDHVAWHWDAETRDVEGESALVFDRGAAEVGTTHLTFTPTLYGFNLHSPTLFERGDIALEVPTVRADQWFFSAPASLFGLTRDAELEGDWGMTLQFPIAWTGPDHETGRRGLDIGAPTEFRIDDDNLHLLSLPESIDVRRLNEGMTFTFTGPPGTAARTLGIPAPDDPEAARRTPQGWVELEDISYHLVAALLYREDGRFFRNHGINWYQWRAVIEQAWEARAFGRGASTISMQLVKNVFLTHERTVERKLQELFLTYWMTRLVPKDRILETYLNVIEWGPGVNGIVEAARYYFDTTPSRLSLAESVWLASAVPAPARRARQRAMGEPPEWSVRRGRDVMRGMERSGWITEAELEAGMRERVRFTGDRGRVVAVDLEGEPPLGAEASLPQTPADSADFEHAAGGEVPVDAPLDGDIDGRPSPAGVILSSPPRERLLQLIESQLATRP